MSSSKPAIPPTPSALCQCSTATSLAPACRRGRPPPIVATPAAPISPAPSNAVSPTSPFTKRAASPLPTWSKALGSTAACATSAPGSRPHLPLRARLWRGPLHLAGAATLQRLHLVRGRGAQLDAVRPPQTDITATACAGRGGAGPTPPAHAYPQRESALSRRYQPVKEPRPRPACAIPRPAIILKIIRLWTRTS